MATQEVIEGHTVTVFNDGTVARTCWKCDGKRRLEWYAGTDEGRCWKCDARGYLGKRHADRFAFAKWAIQAERRNRLARERSAAKRRTAPATAKQTAALAALAAEREVPADLAARLVNPRRAEVDELFGALRAIPTPAQAAAAAQREAEQREAERVAALSQHVGAEGERVTVTGKVTKAIMLDGGQYGPKMLVELVTETGNVVNTFTTAEWSWSRELESEPTITVKGTVKRHGAYRGTKTTTLTRCARTA